MMKTFLQVFLALCISTQLHGVNSRFSPYYSSRPTATYNEITPCDNCNRFWGEVDYLFWKLENSPDPIPLVIQAPAGTPSPIVLGTPGSTVVLGGKDIENNWRSGGRIFLGCWFDKTHRLGAEVNYFFLPQGSHTNSVSSNGLAGSNILRLPFFDINTGTENSTGIASPDIFSGVATLKHNNCMQGAEANVVAPIGNFCGTNCTIIFGARYWNFHEKLTLATNSPFVNPPIDVYMTKDTFETQNLFYGGQLGATFEYFWGNFFLNATGKVALGANTAKVDVSGYLKTNDYTDLGEVIKYPGGYLTFPSNLGHHKKTYFSLIPEVDVNIGYEFCDTIKLEVGYTFIYVSHVLWAGDQINRNFNTTQTTTYTGEAEPVLVGTPSPKVTKKSQGLWVQGLTVGLAVEF